MNSEYFNIVYKKYFTVLHAYSKHIVYSDEVSEDIVQEVFLECWDRRKTIDTSIPLKSYLYTLTYRKSIDYLRKSESKNIQFSSIDSPLDQLFFETLNPDEHIDVHEMEKIIKGAVSLLPPKCKEVFLLSRHNGMKNKEIAETLNLSIKTVEKHISKALMQIRKVLDEKGYLLYFLLFDFFFNK
ncbi:MAG: RNA polymerase sigma-70 factor [Dysgonamonadaceae bacterium]|jgi:RNA polymerase sigma-70 factor (ECF subfamily)|nr:RNA polymerase sigma-70 factor [Dysgonamonadaceae bacterium]